MDDGCGAETETGAGAAGAAPGAGLRLEKRTHLNGTGYRGSFIDYGEGLAEFGLGFVSAHRKSSTRRGESVNREGNELRALRRARSRLRQLVLGSGASYMLTLTYRANVTDFEQANADLSAFLRQVKRHYPKYRYIAVAERQERGAWHWHVAVHGWQDVAFLRDAWRRVVGEGNIDVRPPRYGNSNLRLGLVRYLSKYLAKSFSDAHALNARRFRSSHGIEVPIRRTFLPVRTFDQAKELCENWLRARSQGTLFMFASEQKFIAWGCTW